MLSVFISKTGIFFLFLLSKLVLLCLTYAYIITLAINKLLEACCRKIPTIGLPATITALPASLPSPPPPLLASLQLCSFLQKHLASFYAVFSLRSGLDMQINRHLGWANLHTYPDWLVGEVKVWLICMFIFY
uniref:Uncharacterized protein n=1 Tax=Pipistrellus kuhlii TaxID=59472 RepID=A0A7J7YMG8_PIPKU|nr:hypothetical protein mPipKuh1_010119 [Pipistrellus kuhlii]